MSLGKVGMFVGNVVVIYLQRNTHGYLRTNQSSGPITQNDEMLRHRICQLIIDEWQFLKAPQVARFSALA